MADSRIKVLIVDDNETTRRGTYSLLEFETDIIEIIGFAENGREAIAEVKSKDPDVVLMDINMPEMNGIEATKILQAEAPRTQVIIVSVQDDAHYLKEGFRAGAVDFVAKPVSSDELVQAIRRAYDQIPAAAPPPPVAPDMSQMRGPGPAQVGWSGGYDGKVITVTGLKGGVGKTMLAVNLAIALKHIGKEVLLIDANLLLGDVSVFLNTRSPQSIVHMAQETAISSDVEDEYVDRITVEHESGVRLLVAPANPSESEPISQQAMVNMFTYFRRKYDYIVVDTASYFDEVLVASLQEADKLLVVTAPNMPALKDTRLLFNELDAIEFPMNNIMLVLNWVDSNSRISADQISNFLKQQVIAEIPTDPNGTESVNQGIPLINGDARRSPAVRKLNELAQIVREAVDPELQQEVHEDDSGGKKRGGWPFG